MGDRVTYAEAWEMGTRRNRMPGHDGPANEPPLLQKVAFWRLRSKVRKWGKNMLALADKRTSESNTMRGGLIGFLGIVVISLIQVFRSKLLELGLSDHLIDQAISLLQIITGAGGALAALPRWRSDRGHPRAPASDPAPARSPAA